MSVENNSLIVLRNTSAAICVSAYFELINRGVFDAIHSLPITEPYIIELTALIAATGWGAEQLHIKLNPSPKT